MRSEWEPIPAIKVQAGVFFPAIAKGYDERMFCDLARSNYGDAMIEAKRIAEWQNLPWWRRWFTDRP